MERRGATVEAASMRNPEVTLTAAMNVTRFPSSPGADWFASSRPASQAAPDFPQFELSSLRTTSSVPAIDPTLGEMPQRAAVAVQESESEPDISDRSDSETPEPPRKSSSLFSQKMPETPATDAPPTPSGAFAEPALGDQYTTLKEVKAAFLAWGKSQTHPFTMGGCRADAGGVRLNDVGCECQGPVRADLGGCTFRARFKHVQRGGHAYQLVKIFSPDWTHGYRYSFNVAPDGKAIVAKKPSSSGKKAQPATKVVKTLPAIEKPRTRPKSVAVSSTKKSESDSRKPSGQRQPFPYKRLAEPVASTSAVVIEDDDEEGEAEAKSRIIASNEYDSSAPALGQLFRSPEAFWDSKNIWSGALAGNESFNFVCRTRDGKLPHKSEHRKRVEIGCPATVAGASCGCVVVAEQTDFEGDVCWEIKVVQLGHSAKCPHKALPPPKRAGAAPVASTSKQRIESAPVTSTSHRKRPSFVVDVSQRKRPSSSIADSPSKRQKIAPVIAAAVADAKDKAFEVDEVLNWLRKRLVDLADYDELKTLASYLVDDGLTRDRMHFVTTNDFMTLVSSRFGVEEPITANLIEDRLGLLGLVNDSMDKQTVRDVQMACGAGSLSLALKALHPLLGSERVVDALAGVKLTSAHLNKATKGIERAIDKSLKEQKADALTPFEMILLQKRLTAYTKAVQNEIAQ